MKLDMQKDLMSEMLNIDAYAEITLYMKGVFPSQRPAFYAKV